LADQLAAALGANLFYTRLTGHGQDGTALAEATVNDWLNDAVEALAIGRRLGKRVILMGASTGGLLATWLAGQPQTDDMAAVLLLSPNFGLNERSSEIMLWPWARYLVPLLAGPIQSRSPFNEEDGLYWTTTYPTTALMPVMGLVKLSRSFDYAKLQTPIFVAYSPHDTRVDPKLIEQRFQQFGSPVKQLQAVETAEDPFQHVIAGRIRSPGTTDWLTQQLLDFVQPLLTTN
jgi:alpha-beta hydrolase superfamily lysophospholipase